MRLAAAARAEGAAEARKAHAEGFGCIQQFLVACAENCRGTSGFCNSIGQLIQGSGDLNSDRTCSDIEIWLKLQPKSAQFLVLYSCCWLFCLVLQMPSAPCREK